MSTRTELSAIAIRLRSEGLTQREIAERMGIPRSSAVDLYTDPDRSKALARRATYAGTCEVCGARTDGSSGRAKAPRYCQAHIGSNPEWLAANTKWPSELIVARIREWADLYGEPPALPDWGPSHAREMHDEERALRFEQADGRWPWFTIVVNRFGSWNAAIAAAGFEPRAATGTAENQQRRRNVKERAA